MPAALFKTNVIPRAKFLASKGLLVMDLNRVGYLEQEDMRLDNSP